jgi:hypothetical protein
MYACDFSPPCEILAQTVKKELLEPPSLASEKRRQRGQQGSEVELLYTLERWLLKIEATYMYCTK